LVVGDLLRFFGNYFILAENVLLEQYVGKKLFIKGIDVRDYFFECLVLSLVKPEKL
jgi:hypothetical protein